MVNVDIISLIRKIIAEISRLHYSNSHSEEKRTIVHKCIYMWGELVSHKIYLMTTPVLKTGHPGEPCYICLFVLSMVGWVTLIFVFLKLVWYAHVFKW